MLRNCAQFLRKKWLKQTIFSAASIARAPQLPNHFTFHQGSFCCLCNLGVAAGLSTPNLTLYLIFGVFFIHPWDCKFPGEWGIWFFSPLSSSGPPQFDTAVIQSRVSLNQTLWTSPKKLGCRIWVPGQCWIEIVQSHPRKLRDFGHILCFSVRNIPEVLVQPFPNLHFCIPQNNRNNIFE